MSLRKNVASQVLTFALVNATTGAALTGATVTTKVALDGTQSAGAGTVTELGTGQYKYVPTQGETDGASVGFCFTATNAVPVNLHCFTTSQDPTIAQTGDSYARLGAPAGASVSADIAAVPTVGAIADAVWDEDIVFAHQTAGAAGWYVQETKTLVEELPNASAFTNAVWDADLGLHTGAGSTGKKLGDLSTGTPLDAAGVRSAVGLASANLDTQLTAIDDLIDTEVAAIKAKTDLIPAAPASTTNITAASGIAVSSIGANVITATSIAANAITSAKIATDAIGAAQLAADAVAEIADANWDEALVGHAAFGSAGERLDSLYTVYLAGGADGTVVANNALDAAAVRTAVGLATANLDTQLAAIDDLLDTEVAAIYNRLGAPAGASIAADIGAATLGDSIGQALSTLSADVATMDNYVDTEVAGLVITAAAIQAKTDLIPAAPAATGDIPSAATVASQVRTELTTELGRIDAAVSTRLATAGYTAPLDAAGVRTAVGLATANLDTQLTAIDDLIDTEVGAIKTKTDYLPSATAGAAGGLFIAGANAATTVNITGDITGNLSGSVGAVAANGITATSIATDAINAAAVKADAVTKIQNGLATPTNITAAAGIALSAGERTTLANAILDVADGATTNYTLREALEVMLAVLAGKLSGAATATITIRDVNDTKNVVVATTDASGNRTAVTVTP